MKTTASATNLPAVQQFGRNAALLSPTHSNELAALAASPERTVEVSEKHMAHVAATFGIDAGGRSKPFLFADGLAVIPVWGALLHRDAWVSRYATGYDYVQAMFAAAMNDDDVKGIVFDLNSYGGHVAGNFELAEMIYEAREVKPSVAIVDARALSGGYSLASAAGKIIATPSADIGSIGVVLMHVSFAEMLKEDGIEVTFIYAGDHKVDGNPYEELSDDDKAALQAGVKRSYDQFVALVARNRGLETQAVIDTQARVFDADEAKTLGLIDAVMPPRAAYAAFAAELSGSSSTPSPSKESKKMTDKTNSKKAGGEGEEELTQTDISNAASAASANERTRIAAIVNSDEAKGREAQANHLAFNTSMSAEEAVQILAAGPKSEPKAEGDKGKGRLAAALDGEADKTVGADGGGDKQIDDEPKSRSSRLVSAMHKATGITPKTKK